MAMVRVDGNNTTLLLHSFNGLFSRTNLVSRHQKSRTILVKPIWTYWSKRDSEWQWQICTSPQMDNHAITPPLSFFTGRMPFLLPTNSVKALKACGWQQPTSIFTAQVGWLGVWISGYMVLSWQSRNEWSELLQWLWSWRQHHKSRLCYCYY